MNTDRKITIISNRRKRILQVNKILGIHMRRKHADVYMSDGEVIETRTTYKEFEELLGNGFIEIRRGSLVSAIAIHDVTETVNLNNGVMLKYTVSRKKEIETRLYQQRRYVINQFPVEGIPRTEEEYCKYYSGFENLPVAFTDIEMIFDDECRAVDWVFRYGNQALADLENVPLDKLIGRTFGNIFPNMDEKWLRSYERAVLFGETLGMNEYSPEVDKYLNILCFPTFAGHCGCILIDISKVQHIKNMDHPENIIKIIKK